MIFKIIDDPIIRCECCGTQYKIPKEAFEYDNSYIGEFGMGERYEHVFYFEGTCGDCGKHYSITLNGSEYPAGAFEYQTSKVNGCEIIFEPRLSVNYIEYYIPDEYENWVAEDMGELIEQIKADPIVVRKITPRKFEELVAELFARKGYEVTLTPAQKDGGKDIIARRNDDGIPICLYIECKHYDVNNPVGVNIVRSACGLREHDKVNKAIVVTTSRFTKGAFEYANEEEHLIQLMSLDDLLGVPE